MTAKPTISVVVPTVRRPELATVAVESVLRQDTRFSVEIILSNNGGDAETRRIFTAGPYAGRVQYIETPDILPMPDHWEWATGQARGEFLLVLPDRRMLKQGAIDTLVSALESRPDCDACCTCDDWVYASGRMSSSRTFQSDVELDTKAIRAEVSAGRIDPNTLPLGLNSIVRTGFVERYRREQGEYFGAISPDYRSAFNYLFQARSLFVVAKPQIITRGFTLSNGGSSVRGDRSYARSLGDRSAYAFVPRVFEGNVWASICEDFLRSANAAGHDADFGGMMSPEAMNRIMLEEMQKLVMSGGGRAAATRFRRIRRALADFGWSWRDDAASFGRAAPSLKQFLPEPIKAIYRKAYGLSRKPERDIFRVAGF